jgi:hypothetical protein
VAAAAGGPVQDAVLPAGTEFDHHRRERQQDSPNETRQSQDLTDILRSEAGGGPKDATPDGVVRLTLRVMVGGP